MQNRALQVGTRQVGATQISAAQIYALEIATGTIAGEALKEGLAKIARLSIGRLRCNTRRKAVNISRGAWDGGRRSRGKHLQPRRTLECIDHRTVRRVETLLARPMIVAGFC